MHRVLGLFLLAPLLPAAPDGPPAGEWSAVLQVEDREIPFRMLFEPGAGGIRGAVLDGERRIWSTSGAYRDGKLELRWDYFDATLTAVREGGRLRGTYARRTRSGLATRAFSARPREKTPPAGRSAAQIAGRWIFTTKGQGPKGVMEGHFTQSGARIEGTLQRLDGDFGVLEGRAEGGRITLSHFDLVRATLVELTLSPDGSLSGTINRRTAIQGVRAEKKAATPPDPSTYTRVRDPFTFRFPDATGRMVSSTDERFRGKPLIVSIMGTWCPNCHDEAELLAELYRKYNGAGLEIVALCFEYTDDAARGREQMQAFARRHNVRYPMLLAGTTEEGDLEKKLPQVENFAAYPTTIFLGRDGRFRAAHAGFAGPANPAEHRKVRDKMERLVQELLRK
jgi:thiol-disulfide isomerase/thioredoxin